MEDGEPGEQTTDEGERTDSESDGDEMDEESDGDETEQMSPADGKHEVMNDTWKLVDTVAIAYEDGWYLAVVANISSEIQQLLIG